VGDARDGPDTPEGQADPSGPWTLDVEATDNETRFALSVLASRIKATNAGDVFMTRAEVSFGARLLRVLPPKPDGLPRLSAADAWRLARDYLTREERGEGAEGYLVWLAAGADSDTLRDWWRQGFIGLGTDLYVYGIEGPWPPASDPKVISPYDTAAWAGAVRRVNAETRRPGWLAPSDEEANDVQ